MYSLENIVEINSAINLQKNKKEWSFPKVFQEATRESSIDSKVQDPKKTRLELEFEQVEIKSRRKSIVYDTLDKVSSYVKNIKEAAYSYYSSTTTKVKASVKGYTDKLLKEFEDWGVVYFKTTLRKLSRLTPMGKTQRYLEKLWIYVGKKLK